MSRLMRAAVRSWLAPCKLTPTASALVHHSRHARNFGHVIQRPTVRTTEQRRHAQASVEFLRQLKNETSVEGMLDTWENHHTQLQLPEHHAILQRLAEVKLNNMHQIRLKMSPAELNPMRDPRMTMVLEAIQVRVLNRQSIPDNLAELGELCRGMALFRHNVHSFWMEMAEIILPKLEAGASPRAVVDVAWAFGRMQVAGHAEVNGMFERMGRLVLAEEGNYEHDNLYMVLWAMNECLHHDGALSHLYKARQAALDSEIEIEHISKDLNPELAAQYTDLQEAVDARDKVTSLQDAHQDTEETDLYASDDSEEDRILGEDTLPEWAVRQQAFTPKTIDPQAHPLEVLQHYRSVVQTHYEGPHATYGQSTAGQEEAFASMFPRVDDDTDASVIDLDQDIGTAFGKLPELTPQEADAVAERAFQTLKTSVANGWGAETLVALEDSPFLDNLLRVYVADLHKGHVGAPVIPELCAELARNGSLSEQDQSRIAHFGFSNHPPQEEELQDMESMEESAEEESWDAQVEEPTH